MPSDPRTSAIALSTQALWSNGATFDGVLRFTLSSSNGAVGLKNTDQHTRIPKYTDLRIVDGALAQSEPSLFYNADLNPPGTTYTAQFVDMFGTAIASVAGGAFSVSNPTTTVTVPVLTVP